MNWLLITISVFVPTGHQHVFTSEWSMEMCMYLAFKADVAEYRYRLDARHEGREPFFKEENYCIPNLWEQGEPP